MEDFKGIQNVFVHNQGVGGRSLEIAEKYNGMEIVSISLNNDVATFKFKEGGFEMRDDGQSCCESRWMHSEDEKDFDYHIGAIFRFIQVVAGDGEESSECHDTEYCNILTSKGVLQFVCHNEHNGYYGGFSVQLEEL